MCNDIYDRVYFYNILCIILYKIKKIMNCKYLILYILIKVEL